MIRLRRMTADDLPLGMRLKDQAGWNQIEADWHRFLELGPEGCFVADLDGRPVGTAATCVLGSVGWIAMVLVDASVRHRGIGTRLVEHALDSLNRQGVRTVRLDATPLGRPIYQRLGFLPDYELVRWEGSAPERLPPAGVRPATPEQLDAVIALDGQITATDRAALIRILARQQPEALRVFAPKEKLLGYLTFRPGWRAVQVGPGVALDEQAGRTLGDAVLASCAGRRVFVDVPKANLAATRWAQTTGLVVQRELTRMSLGQRIRDQPARLWASSGPESG